MSSASKTIDEHKNTISSISQPLAVIGLEKTGKRMAGKLLTPAVWAMNYAVNGKTPDKLDVGLAGLGLVGGAAVPASIVTSIAKSILDDEIEARLKMARLDEDHQYRNTFIHAITSAWLHPELMP